MDGVTPNGRHSTDIGGISNVAFQVGPKFVQIRWRPQPSRSNGHCNSAQIGFYGVEARWKPQRSIKNQTKGKKNRPRFDASSENPVEFEDTWAAIGRFAAETFGQLFKRAENPVEIGFYSVVHRNWSKLNSFVQHFHKNPTNPSGNLLKMVSTGQKV